MIRAVLTIDDITSDNTPAIVDYLKEKGIKALLFAIGEALDRSPDEAVYALQNGMLVGNHSYSHPHFSELSEEDCIKEIEKCEERLDALYRSAKMNREYRFFRFPYGDKGGKNAAALQAYLREQHFDKVSDRQLSYPWWHERGLDTDIDTFWTYDVEEYRVRPGSGFTMEDVMKKIHDPAPSDGAAILADNTNHIILLHAHDETQELAPGYYVRILEELLKNGVEFVDPTFI